MRAIAYGGVVFDQNQKLLLRSPTGHFDGYHWTFAKGRPEAEEMAEEAALREVLEETGARCEIVYRLPNVYPGGTTDAVFFMMRFVALDQPFDATETDEIRWVTLAEAVRLVSETTNTVGRRRDLDVIEAAKVFLASLNPPQETL